MAKNDYKNAPMIRCVYRSDVQGKVSIGDMVKETAKLMKVRDRDQWRWTRTVRKDAPPIARWFDSPREALASRVEELHDRIRCSKEKLQQERTWLGMVEGELSRLTGEPSSVDAVDPADGTGTEGPRA